MAQQQYSQLVFDSPIPYLQSHPPINNDLAMINNTHLLIKWLLINKVIFL